MKSKVLGFDPIARVKTVFGDERIEFYLDKDPDLFISHVIFDGRAFFNLSAGMANYLLAYIENGTLKHIDDKLPNSEITLKDLIAEVRDVAEASEYVFSILTRYQQRKFELRWKATHPDDPTNT